MTQQEFTQRTGIEVETMQYAAIEQVYMYTELDKDDFCADYKKHGDSVIISHLVNELDKTTYERGRAHASLKEYKALMQDIAEMLIHKADEHMDEELYNSAINIIGVEECIKYKFINDLELTKEDKEYILKVLKDRE